VKVWGLRNLNRALPCDEVVVQFVQWKDWGKASDKKTAGLNFEERVSSFSKGGEVKPEEAEDDQGEEEGVEEEGEKEEGDVVNEEVQEEEEEAKEEEVKEEDEQE
jgi:hypothetical protein